MTASPSELSLECKPHSCSMLLKSFGEQSEQTQKLEDFLLRLEAERVKIDAFKRELPLCMQLLTNAMEASRQQLQSYRVNQGPQVPVLEEFIPIKHSSSQSTEKASNKSDNKANWMTNAQLWNEASDATKQLEQHSNIIRSTTPSKENEICFNVRKGGAFLPFSKERERERERVALLPDHLGLASAHKEVVEDKKLICENNTEMNGILSTMEIGCERTSNTINGAEAIQQVKAETQTTATTAHQTHRKARRCWSPDLHRRFVNALQMLGGSQVATPKQIRELMKVEGLTNDEVKSHLQKYRLHTRRPNPTPQAAGTTAHQLVVLGGIWVPPEYATAAVAAAHGGAAPALYGVAHASPHYCGPPVPQKFYHAPPQPHHSLHSQLDLYKASSSLTHSSPESDVRAAENRTESRDDSKSESNN